MEMIEEIDIFELEKKGKIKKGKEEVKGIEKIIKEREFI